MRGRNWITVIYKARTSGSKIREGWEMTERDKLGLCTGRGDKIKKQFGNKISCIPLQTRGSHVHSLPQ
jgi:hypothetical protein